MKFRYSIFLALSILLLCAGACKKDTAVVRIGTICPLTGSAATYGKKMTQAINMAFDEVNQQGGINGRKLIAVHEDDKIEPRLSVSAAQKLISVDKVPVIIGPASSGATLAVAPVAERSKVILITPIASAVAIGQAGDYVFRIAPSDAFQARDAAKWVYESGFRKVAVLYINNDYGVGLQSNFERDFKKLGGQIVASEGFEQGSSDYRTQLLKAKQVQADAIFIPAYIEESGRILRQRKELGITAQVFGTDPCHDSNIFQLAGDAANGTWFLDAAGGSGPAYDEFAAKYKARYNMDAEVVAAESYDAAVVIIKAMQAAGSSDPAAIKNALYNVKFDGASGRIEFDANGDVPTKSFQRFAITNQAYNLWQVH